jgi:hypothetical protein
MPYIRCARDVSWSVQHICLHVMGMYRAQMYSTIQTNGSEDHVPYERSLHSRTHTRPTWIVLLQHNCLDALHNFWKLCREICSLALVLLHVVKKEVPSIFIASRGRLRGAEADASPIPTLPVDVPDIDPEMALHCRANRRCTVPDRCFTTHWIREPTPRAAKFMVGQHRLRLRFPLKRRQDAIAINVCRKRRVRHAGNSSRGMEKIVKRPVLLGDDATWHPWTSDKQRRAVSSVMNRPFVAIQRARRSEELVLVPALLVCAVVRRKEQKCRTSLVKRCHHSAQRFIDQVHAVGKVDLYIRPNA